MNNIYGIREETPLTDQWLLHTGFFNTPQRGENDFFYRNEYIQNLFIKKTDKGYFLCVDTGMGVVWISSQGRPLKYASEVVDLFNLLTREEI